MNALTIKDQKNRSVTLHVHAMNGAIFSIIRHDRHDRTTQIQIALTPDECRILAAELIKGHSQAVNIT